MSLNKYLVLLNLLLFATSLAIFVDLGNFKDEVRGVIARIERQSAEKINNSGNVSDGKPANNIPANNTVITVPSAPVPGNSIDFFVSDSGFSQKIIQIFLGDNKKIIKIMNKGEKPHSFTIEGLKIDSGTIKPGETKEIDIVELPEGRLIYNFFSDQEGDDRDLFSGQIIFVKK